MIPKNAHITFSALYFGIVNTYTLIITRNVTTRISVVYLCSAMLRLIKYAIVAAYAHIPNGVF